jgi:hypothetical protein
MKELKKKRIYVRGLAHCSGIVRLQGLGMKDKCLRREEGNYGFFTLIFKCVLFSSRLDRFP